MTLSGGPHPDITADGMNGPMENLLQNARKLFATEYHNRIFLVGGSVRDSLLQQPVHDLDLIAAVPEEYLRECGFHLVCGKTTTPIWFRHESEFGNIELSRIESAEELEVDLRRRDFTVNAMALRLDGRMFDPLQGQQDIQQRILRHSSEQVFQDDPLRIIRACRFMADGWQICNATELLIRTQSWSRQLALLPVERLTREMVKALAGRYPNRFFECFMDLNVGRHWLPELFRMQEIPAGPAQHHPEGDLLTHSLQVLLRTAEVTTDPLTRLCALFHDIGKLTTNPVHYPRHHGHDVAGYTPALELCRRLRLPADWGTSLAWTSRLHTHLNMWDKLRDATKLRIAEQALKAGISDILPIVSVADKLGNDTPADWQAAIVVAAMNCDQLGIDNEQVAAMPVKYRAGFILQKRIEQYRNGPYTAERIT